MLSLVLILFLTFTPTPYRLMAPGRALEVAPMVQIQGVETYLSQGAFLLPTVVSEPASLLYCIVGLLDQSAVLVDSINDEAKGQLFNAQTGSRDRQMQLSQYFAARIALEELGYEIEDRITGVRVLSVAPDSPNRTILQVGDHLVALQGEPITSMVEFLERIRNAESQISADVERDGVLETRQLNLKSDSDKPRLGLRLRPRYEQRPLPVEISFSNGNTVGASGGLAFALEIVNRLTPKDLTGGRIIAVSGTVEPDGAVGAVDGLAFKIVAAERSGASMLLYPQENIEDVREVQTSLTLVPVTSYKEALDALAQ